MTTRRAFSSDLAAGLDPVAYFKANHARVVSIHVKDRGADPKHSDNPFGKGATPITSFCRALKDSKFAYAANIEYEIDENDPTMGVKDSFEYVKKALA